MESRSDLEETLRRKLQHLNRLNEQMIRLIDQYTFGIENLILTKRYLQGRKVADIAKDLHFTPRQIQRLTNRAIEKIVLPEDAIWLQPLSMPPGAA